jgi:hypothetical protein
LQLRVEAKNVKTPEKTAIFIIARVAYGTEGFWFESRWVYLESLQIAGFFRFL